MNGFLSLKDYTTYLVSKVIILLTNVDSYLFNQVFTYYFTLWEHLQIDKTMVSNKEGHKIAVSVKSNQANLK